MIIRGDARHLPLADNTVDLIITSPPYFALRSYQDGGKHYAGQVGDEPTPHAFVDSLLEVTTECMRVLKPTGSMWMNLGDKYTGGRGAYGTMLNHLNTGPLADMRQGARDGNRRSRPHRVDGMPANSLIGIPWRYALRCIDELGLILRGEVVWSKPNGLPESVKTRVRRSHEQLFHFVLQPKYFSAIDEIRVPYEGDRDISRRIKRPGAPHKHEQAPVYTEDDPLGSSPGSVWEIPTEPLIVPEHLGVDHYAAFPTELPRRVIAGWCPTGICTKCGEGRRPWVRRGAAYDAFRLATGDYNKAARDEGYDPAMGRQRATTGKVAADFRIHGYVCSCTPYVDHPGTPVDRDDGRATGLRPRTTTGSLGNAETTGAWREYLIADWDAADTRPAVVLDPFGGTGTTAVVAEAMGRKAIHVDKSWDYCDKIARWRTTDQREIAKAMQIKRPAKQLDGQSSVFDFLEG